jgi:hypothetical protein
VRALGRVHKKAAFHRQDGIIWRKGNRRPPDEIKSLDFNA